MSKYEIDCKEVAEVGGEKYYLRIRGQDVKNPVVLFLHGGCGSPDRAHMLRFQSPLAEKFTLVAWDQRGSGLAYDKREAANTVLTRELIVSDAVNVVGWLKRRFGKDKIIIVGHSWGSAIGVWLAQAVPEDICAYVGIGQVVDYVRNEQMSYVWTLEEAKRTGDVKSLETLAEIGYPENGVYAGDNRACQMKQRAVLHKLGGATYANRRPYWQELLFHDIPIVLGEYGLSGAVKYIKGISYSGSSPMARDNPDFMNTAKSWTSPFILRSEGTISIVCTHLPRSGWRGLTLR